ncbi:retrovirus-related pol polyprotein from transposon TNT 1-94 [Tanacetum coccineum]|uniref:Retrovirus-related pol polyprotein from transposon TNT 1-94 n=1 Tax=Tanacetum coccineum TaxID=301880 RepID=A0ABQ4XG67_9ASTR
MVLPAKTERKKFALGELCPLTKLSVQCPYRSSYGNLTQLFNIWTRNQSKRMNFVEKISGSVRFGNDHLGAIMGFMEIIFIGDSVISKVYYVEGLRHNLFSVGQFCNSDLEVAFRKHTCFVHDINGTDILKRLASTKQSDSSVQIMEWNSSTKLCLNTMKVLAYFIKKGSKLLLVITDRSLIHTRHNKTPYELVHGKISKPKLNFLGFFVGMLQQERYRIYNKRTHRLMETIHVTFDEMHQSMAPVCMSSGPKPFVLTPGQLTSGFSPTDTELEMLFQPMFDEYIKQSRVNEPVPSATDINAQVVPSSTSLSTTIAQDAPSTSALSSTSDMHHPVRHQEIEEEPTHEDPPINHDVLPSHNLVTGEPGSVQSSSGSVNSADPNQGYRQEEDDVKTAFFECDLQEDVFVSQPEGFEDQENPTHVYHLKKALYGLKQTPRAWYDILSKFLFANNLFKGAVDPTSYNAVTYYQKRCALNFNVEMGQMSFFLWTTSFSNSPRGILYYPSKISLKTLKKYGMDLSDPVEQPMVDQIETGRDLMGFQYQAKPTKKHLEAIKSVLSYLKGTIKHVPLYPKDRRHFTAAYADADHAGCQDSRKN